MQKAGNVTCFLWFKSPLLRFQNKNEHKKISPKNVTAT